MLLALLITFLVVVLTGPAGRDWAERRKALKSRPLAKVLPFPYPPGHPYRVK